MAIALSTLVEEADRFLNAARIADYCPNGLQVEGRPQVRRIVSGVTASQVLLDAAVEAAKALSVQAAALLNSLHVSSSVSSSLSTSRGSNFSYSGEVTQDVDPVIIA